MTNLIRSAIVAILALTISAASASAAPSAAAIEQTVRGYWSALSSMNTEEALALFAEGAESVDPWGSPAVVGTEARRQAYAGLSGAFRSVTFAVGRLKINGDRAAVSWSARATLADGRSVSFDGIDVFEFDDRGLITKQWGYWDPSFMMPQSN